MIGGKLATAVLAMASATVIAGSAVGQGTPLPERRITVEAGVDFYGSDLRSIYGTTLPICRDACLAEGACTAFTFNTGRERLLPQVRRRRAHRLPGGALGDARPAAGRARRAGGGAGGRRSASCPTAASPRRARPRSPSGFPPASPIAEAAVAAELAAACRRRQPDRRGRRLGGARGLRRRRRGRGLGPARGAARPRRSPRGSTPSFAPAATPRPGEAARLTGVALEADGEGRAVARRPPPRRAPRPRAGDRGGGGAGRGPLRLPRRRPPGRLRGGEPARLLRPSPSPSPAPASTTPTSSASTPGPSRSRPATASSASTASPMAAATR